MYPKYQMRNGESIITAKTTYIWNTMLTSSKMLQITTSQTVFRPKTASYEELRKGIQPG